MKINNPNVRKWDKISINSRRNKDGSPVAGLVISQRGAFILASAEEWEELKRAGDALIAAQKPRKRYRMI
ncbi:Uncharacterised protein [Mycobacteroides abscessus subsp. abscessus]|uniref:hypothetical protein n=1 Tax=Mycobacteroides abscessus TaxID=36809 RepID=UPI00092B6090|nr:hypothetical protein [Mycobacteroides abscessus]SHT43630.1 Uncharacterised protein [Mycobacteroides abscessus subsp. abscessus]SLK74650.1 Uncharacterised protein [Mycobacteroides abscessus subsp. abscessus]